MRQWKRLHRPGWYERVGWLTWRVEEAAVVPWWLGVLYWAWPERRVIYTVRGFNVPARLWLAVWCWVRRPWQRLDGYHYQSWLIHQVLHLEGELAEARGDVDRLSRLLGRERDMEDQPPVEGGRGW